MPRGSKPGERRGGRQRGTPNKTTLLKNAVFLAAAVDPNRSPLDFMLALVRDPQVPLDLRFNMAAAAAPFVHVRPEPLRKRHPDPLDLTDRLGESVGAGDLKFGVLETKPEAGNNGGGSSPLEFLLGVMNDREANPRQRVKAAAIAARYKHPHAEGSVAPGMIVVEDKFGFEVDPELACAERDDRLRETRLRTLKERSAEGISAKSELEQIRKRRVERLALLKFPDGYTYADLEADQGRLHQLYNKRLSRKKLTPEEDAEEAHLAVRIQSPAKRPQIPVLPIFEKTDEVPVESIYRLEVLRFDEKLTPTEADELKELRRQYPERAERTRNLVVRRLSEHRAKSDYTRRLGFDPGPDEGWPRI